MSDALVRAIWEDKLATLVPSIVCLETKEMKNERDQAFMKDVTHAVSRCVVVLDVYTNDKEIHPGYALEKLRYARDILDGVVSYFEGRLEEVSNDKG